ncbi:MAG: hypothetical protein Q9213_006992 [Squamulea squamosa]
MRLLNTESLQFSEFFDHDIPDYAILSHRWGVEEVTLQHFEHGTEQQLVGFRKIRDFCTIAEEKGHRWVWIDTCCIDKRSSAELSEAINSMYKWYENATACYAYLADVLWEKSSSKGRKQFQESVWFTRGWTLQELLAPSQVLFFDRHWEYMGDKDDFTRDISEITGIDMRYIHDRYWHWFDAKEPCTRTQNCRGHLRGEPSVATKMSWASKRQTSRIEDMAYCLLGIFDVNMPLLYGEGHKAFKRLQHEIIKQSNDDSIFAWTDEHISSVFAPWPWSFAKSGCVQQRGTIKTHRRPYALTNQGLDFPITWRAWDLENQELMVLLDCGICGPQGFKNVMLRLYSRSGDIWTRVNSQHIETADTTYTRETSEKDVWYNPQDPTRPQNSVKAGSGAREAIAQGHEVLLNRARKRIMIRTEEESNLSYGILITSLSDSPVVDL